ncbi:MAG: type VI secretion system contractile sheath small subunit [Aestuariivita sp.]|nr:type VI secretion system contractile sheath small subunit [Aestuariivita sp.]
MSSSQYKVGKVRPPRVQITYDVEDGDASETRELPMVVGVISDLSGDNVDSVEYKEREFIEVEQGGVDRLMSRIGPSITVSVSDQISGEQDQEVGASLQFNSIEDFSPMGVAAQMPQTAKLLEARRRLADLYSKIEANDKLDGILGDVLADADKCDELRKQLGNIDNKDGEH